MIRVIHQYSCQAERYGLVAQKSAKVLHLASLEKAGKETEEPDPSGGYPKHAYQWGCSRMGGWAEA